MKIRIEEELNEKQRQAVTFGEGPLLIMAGAGSGKTKVLTYRTAWLVEEKNVLPSSIALMTFTNKAAGEMKGRARKLRKGGEDLGFAGTFHTFCVKLLREFGPNVGVNPDFSIFDTDDTESLMKEVLTSMDIDPKQSKPRMFLSVIGKMKNDLVSLSQTEKTASNYFYKQVSGVWKEYQARLKRNNALDFDDLLVLGSSALGIERIQDEMNNRLGWILVDEYQDTNKAQFEITRLLAGKNQNITAVGDASQAIYSFRGADFRNLDLLEKHFPSLKVLSLPKNYRSSQNILDGAYGVIKNNSGHPVIRLLANEPPLLCRWFRDKW